MDIGINNIDGIHVIKVRGRFSIGPGVDEFRSTTDSLRKDGHQKFVLNLAEVPMMDSSAIGAVVRLTASSKKEGGNVKLVSPSAMVVQTLKIVGLMNLYEVFPDDQAAAKSFTANAGSAVPS